MSPLWSILTHRATLALTLTQGRELFPSAREIRWTVSPSSGWNRDSSISICTGINRLAPGLTLTTLRRSLCSHICAAANQKIQGRDTSKNSQHSPSICPRRYKRTQTRLNVMGKRKKIETLSRHDCLKIYKSAQSFFLCRKISTNTELKSVGKLFWCLASPFDLVSIFFFNKKSVC